MKFEEHAQECNEALNELVGKKVLEIEFKPYDNNCWRVYIRTDSGKMVMSFCKDWSCPEVEIRDWIFKFTLFQRTIWMEFLQIFHKNFFHPVFKNLLELSFLDFRGLNAFDLKSINHSLMELKINWILLLLNTNIWIRVAHII